MQILFENMPETSRIWIYQANRNISEIEKIEINQFLSHKIPAWAAHGASLLASFTIIKNRFVIIALDESQNGASGCSIDASSNWFKELGQKFSIDFFDRNLIYLAENELVTTDIPKIKEAVLTEKLTPSTIIFNNMVSNIAEMKQNWQTEASKSWVKRYFTTITA
jgi:hypothetical protein